MVASLGAVVGAVVLAVSLLPLIAGATALAYTPNAAAAPPPSPSPGQMIDLNVVSVEVTQATQTATNSIPLVARRSTAVRATIGASGALEYCCVTGTLRIFVDGNEVTPPAGVPPINASAVHAAPDRNNENDTLNFELPAPTPITASTDVDFQVEVRPTGARSGETNFADNTGFANDLTAVERCAPWLYFTRIDYTPSGLGLPPLSQVRAGRGDAFVRGVLPVDDSDLLYGETTPLTFSWDPNGDRILGGEATAHEGEYEQNKLLKLLEMGRQLIVENWIGASDRVFLYGWISGNPVFGNGAAWKGSRVAFGNTNDLLYQRTYAHELLHNFGLSHNDSPQPLGLDEVGWDVGARLVGNPTGNNLRGHVKPAIDPINGPYFDVMTPTKETHEAWINTRNYGFLLQHPTLAGSCLTASFTRVAVVRGLLHPDGQGVARLEPVFRLPWESQPSESRKGGQFLAEVTDTNGVTTTTRFDTQLAESGEHAATGAFSVMVPVDPSAEIASLRITSADGTTQLAEMLRSEPPRIELLSPEPGTVLGDNTEVRWTVEDPDTPDDELLFEAAYSNDGGRSWAPLRVDIPGSERGFTFDASQLPASGGAGVIRVFVSDGLNTAFADVTTG
jgi:hypothetical protein